MKARQSRPRAEETSAKTSNGIQQEKRTGGTCHDLTVPSVQAKVLLRASDGIQALWKNVIRLGIHDVLLPVENREHTDRCLATRVPYPGRSNQQWLHQCQLAKQE